MVKTKLLPGHRLQEASQYMERFYTTNLLRPDHRRHRRRPAQHRLRKKKSANYTLAINSVSANAYVLKVTPKGNQVSATPPAAPSPWPVNGARTISGSGSVAACW